MTPNQALLCLNIIDISEEALPDLLAYQDLYVDNDLRETPFPPILFLLALLQCKDPINFAGKLKIFLQDTSIIISCSSEEIVHKIGKYIAQEIDTAKLIEILSKKLASLEIVNEHDKTLVFSIQCCLLCIQYLQQSQYLSSDSASILNTLYNNCLVLLPAQEGKEYYQKKERRSLSIHSLPAIPEDEEESIAAAAAAAITSAPRTSTPAYRRRFVHSGGFPYGLNPAAASSSAAIMRDVKSDNSHDKPKAPSI